MTRPTMLLFLLLAVYLTHSYKILVFAPTISRSHLIANARIANELVRAGHDVVLFEPDFTNLLDSIKQPIKLARLMTVKGFSSGLSDMLSEWSGHVFDEETVFDYNVGYAYWQQFYIDNCKILLEDREIMRKLKEENFDAYIGEQINLCGHGIAHLLGIKVKIMVSSCPVFETLSSTLGYPTPLSYVPVMGMDVNPLESYWARAKNLFYALVNTYYYDNFHVETTRIFKEKYGENFPKVDKLAADSDMILVNTDEFLDIPRPIAPNMINVGGLGASEYENMPLGEEFEKEMEKGVNGVIYFSLGTVVNVTLLPSIYKSVAVLAKTFPTYHFIARAEKEDQHSRRLANDIPNLSVHHWIPQPAILRHPRLKAFITHGGYNSLMEAGWSGVPAVAVPFFLDQFKNAQAAAFNGWGVRVSKFSLKGQPELLIQGVRTVLEDENYLKNAKRISKLIREKPMNASERLVKSVEFTIANGGLKELLMEGRHHSFVHYHNLDIILPFLFVLLSALIFIIWASLILLKMTRGGKQKVA